MATTNGWNNQVAAAKSDITLNAGTNTINISSDAAATTVNLGTGGAVKTVNLGSTNGASTSTLQSGTGALNVTATNGALTINSGTGALSISNDAAATTVNIATGAAAKVATLGSTNGASSLALRYGTADFSLASNTGNTIVALDTGEVTKPRQPAFAVYHSVASVANVTGDGTFYHMPFDTEQFDLGGNFAANTFTAPIAGRYQFNCTGSVGQVGAGHTLGLISLVTTDQTYNSAYMNPANMRASNDILQIQGCWCVPMDAGDTAYVQIGIFNSTKTVDYYAAIGNAAFSGYLVC